MPLKHLTPQQWDEVDAGTPEQETRDHLATCEECRAVVAESRALLVGLRRTGHAQEPGQQRATDHPAAEDLAAYGDGVLVGAGARSIEEHLEHCSDCRDDILVMRDVATAGDLKEPVPPRVRDQLLERLSRARGREWVTSLGEWLVEAKGKFGTVFSPLRRMPAAEIMMASLRSAEEHQVASNAERSKLEAALAEARGQVERARMMMDHATARMRDLSLQFEQTMKWEHEALAGLAAARAEAEFAATRLNDPVGPLLELLAADVRLRIQASDQEWSDVFTATVLTLAGDPAPGVALELRSPTGESSLRTTDAHGQTSFSLERGGSTLRLVHKGVWELQLARQS